MILLLYLFAAVTSLKMSLCRGRIHSLVRTVLLLHICVSRSKEKEMVFRKGPTIIPPVMINGCWACAAVQISWHCSGWQAVLRLKGFIKANLQTRHWTRLYKSRALNKAQLILAGLSLFASDTFCQDAGQTDTRTRFCLFNDLKIICGTSLVCWKPVVSSCLLAPFLD